MKSLMLALSLTGMLLMFPFASRADSLKPGDPAPAFDLLDQHGKRHTLADYQGRWLVLYFYPKDDTPGCTKEACHFRDQYEHLLEKKAAVVGVSLDDVQSHKAFMEKYNLPFPLLADPGGKVAMAYGSLYKLGPLRFARRHSFIIDPQGRLAKIYREVKPAGHAQQVLDDLGALQAESAAAD